MNPERVKEAGALWEAWDEERRAGFLGARFRRCDSVHGDASGDLGRRECKNLISVYDAARLGATWGPET